MVSGKLAEEAGKETRKNQVCWNQKLHAMNHEELLKWIELLLLTSAEDLLPEI